MKIEQIYTGCLAHGAYYIESQGEAAIIDPLREVQPYIDQADQNDAKIKYIFETHFHADFVSGHLTLSEKTGAPIVYGPTAQPAFEAIVAGDGQEFNLGDITLTALHTPGHTMESTTYLLRDEKGRDVAIFTGDTLFLGDVGRPDLAQKAADMTKEELASILFDSLRDKIMPLSDEVIVYPGHGKGSACGKQMSSETVDTLGHQKEVNYALRSDMTREEFVREVTEGLTPPPEYFPFNVQMNKEGYKSIDEVLEKGQSAMDPDAFETAAKETEAVVLDVRSKDEFAEGHIPGSIFIGLDDDFAPWVGALIKDVNQPILLVAPDDRIEEAVTRLSRVGFDHTLGYLDGGISAWEKANKEIDTVQTVEADTLAKRLSSERTLRVFDVRKSNEYKEGHLKNAENTPLDYFNDYMETFPTEGDFYLHCQSGYRSMIANSILKSRGIHHAIDVLGGFEAIRETPAPIELPKRSPVA